MKTFRSLHGCFVPCDVSAVRSIREHERGQTVRERPGLAAQPGFGRAKQPDGRVLQSLDLAGAIVLSQS